ncbi:uncharacterized protein SCHCODRAFT_02602720 [Schizophyllum commune H4-8]|uniref:uncharacterized protein n=1 Tax=Schizophyllum commune (strain H4-8 / FGSC 9210) TaxID=578458 RepID=UPI00215FE84D|nr:uncharacterized protein SCHCODRAFT_02602720 [Schizophyllum commune H4-8]KAI5887047.1 hypothetical protein SCHCODRAFT_02602720 [Schizophyllum commune H4-8]
MSPNLYTAFFRPSPPTASHVFSQDEEPPEAGARHVALDSSSPQNTHRRILKKHAHDHSYDHDRTRSESTISFPRPPSAAKEQPRDSSSKVRSLMDRLRSASLSITWAENEHKAARPSGPSGLQQAFRSAWKRAVALSGRHTPNSNGEARTGPTVIRTPMEAFADDASLAATLTIPAPMGRARSQSESAPRTTVFLAGEQTTGPLLTTTKGPTIVRTAEEAFSPEKSDPTSQAPVSKRPGIRLKRSLTLPPLRITTRTAKNAVTAEPHTSLPARNADRATRQPHSAPAASRKSMAPGPSSDGELRSPVLVEMQTPDRGELQKHGLVELRNRVQVELQKFIQLIGLDKRACLQIRPAVLPYRRVRRGALAWRGQQLRQGRRLSSSLGTQAVPSRNETTDSGAYPGDSVRAADAQSHLRTASSVNDSASGLGRDDTDHALAAQDTLSRSCSGCAPFCRARADGRENSAFAVASEEPITCESSTSADRNSARTSAREKPSHTWAIARAPFCRVSGRADGRDNSAHTFGRENSTCTIIRANAGCAVGDEGPRRT